MGVAHSVSTATRKRLTIQGFGSCSRNQLAGFRFGIRLPYLVCAAVALLGLILVSIPLLAALMVVAFFGVVLPYHPLDYLYNNGIRRLVGRPRVPPRTPQVKFACGVATFWLAVTILLFSQGLVVLGIVWGSIMIGLATLVGTTDICIPSMVYNLITNGRIFPKGY